MPPAQSVPVERASPRLRPALERCSDCRPCIAAGTRSGLPSGCNRLHVVIPRKPWPAFAPPRRRHARRRLLARIATLRQPAGQSVYECVWKGSRHYSNPGNGRSRLGHAPENCNVPVSFPMDIGRLMDASSMPRGVISTSHEADIDAVHDHLSLLRGLEAGDDGHRLLPALLSVRFLWKNPLAQAWRLLRVLQLWNSRLSPQAARNGTCYRATFIT